MSDLIDRQAAIDALAKFVPYAICDESTESYTNGLTDAYNLICQLPSAQPDERMLHESCTDCPLYDKDRHSCPRFNKVIPVTLRELQSVQPEQRWISCSERLPNDRDWYLGIFKEPDTGWINPLPFICDYVGSETKATTKEYWILRGFTDRDEHIDYYFNLECVAWMPFPEPYKGGEQE